MDSFQGLRDSRVHVCLGHRVPWLPFQVGMLGWGRYHCVAVVVASKPGTPLGASAQPQLSKHCCASAKLTPCIFIDSAGVTLTDDYYSAWECRTILSPWADAASDTAAEPQPACALIL